MGILRTYLKKNNTLISGNLSNNAKNPVTEIIYGTLNNIKTRYLFDININDLVNYLNEYEINNDLVKSHKIKFINTISHNETSPNDDTYDINTERAQSFTLNLFNINEEWDEGSGYDFDYIDSGLSDLNYVPSNWKYRKTDELWSIEGGSYDINNKEIIGVQEFDNGNEDLEIDITDYINNRINNTFSGNTYGLGIKYSDDIENNTTVKGQSVAFHTKYTNTFFEPYLETIIDDEIVDDRNYFYLNKNNKLFLYINNIDDKDVIINDVKIYDYQNELYTTFSGNSIVKVKKGVYYIELMVNDYPDAINFRDVWNVTIDNNNHEFINQFLLIDSNNYYNYDSSNIEIDNYHFNFWGINDHEKISSNEIRKVKVKIKELYPNQNNFIPLDIEYRLYIKIGGDYEIDIIPFTKVSRVRSLYEFDLNTSWLIPQDYYLQLRMKNGSYYKTKNELKFTVVSNNIL